MPLKRLTVAIVGRSAQCEVKILAYFVNWLKQSIHLGQSDDRHIADTLERDGEVESLDGVGASG
jgi:hypothetical protein